MEFEDFSIVLNRVGGDLLTATYAVPGGVIQGATAIPFNEEVVENIRLEVEKGGYQAAVAALTGRRGAGSRSAQAGADTVLQKRGTELFASIVPQQIFVALAECYIKARKCGKGLRLRVRTGPDLGMYPYEIIFSQHPPLEDVHLGLQSGLAIVRSRIAPPPDPLSPIEPPLRILVVKASPKASPHYPQIDPDDHELNNLKRALDLPGIDVRVVSGPNTMEQLQALVGTETHALHFIGHGDYDPHRQLGKLIFENKVGGEVAVEAPKIRGLLHGFTRLRLVVLNSCLGNKGNLTQVSSGVAMSVFAMGVPAVVAMQYTITDPAAMAFSKAFYSHLAFGRPVDHALTLARMAVQNSIPDSPEWATPVLYLAPQDGNLFGLKRPVQELLEHARVRLRDREWPTARHVASLIGVQHPTARAECAEAKAIESLAVACEQFENVLAVASRAEEEDATAPPPEILAALDRLARGFPDQEARNRKLDEIDACREMLVAVDVARAHADGDFDRAIKLCEAAVAQGGETLDFLRRRAERERDMAQRLAACKQLLQQGDWEAFGKEVTTAINKLAGSPTPLSLQRLNHVWYCLQHAANVSAQKLPPPEKYAEIESHLRNIFPELAPSNLQAALRIAELGKRLSQRALGPEECAALEHELDQAASIPEAVHVPFLHAVRAQLAVCRVWADIIGHLRKEEWADALRLLDERRKSEPGDVRVEACQQWCRRARRLIPVLKKIAAGSAVGDPTLLFRGSPSPYETLAERGVHPGLSLSACQNLRRQAQGQEEAWDVVCQSGERLLLDFFLYRVARPDRAGNLVRRLLAVENPLAPGMTVEQIVFELKEDAGLFHVLLRNYDEAITFFLQQALARSDDAATLHHLALAAAARIRLHKTWPGELHETERAWELLTLAWAAVVADDRFWQRWGGERQVVYQQPDLAVALVVARHRLEHGRTELLCLAVPAEQEDAALAEIRGARAVQAGGGIPRAGHQGQNAIVGLLGARALGLLGEVRSWARSFATAGRAESWQEKVALYFSELAEPAALLEVRRPERALVRLTRRRCPRQRHRLGDCLQPTTPPPGTTCDCFAEFNPCWGADVAAAAARRLQVEALLQLAGLALESCPADRAAALQHWHDADALAALDGDSERVREPIRQTVLEQVRQLGQREDDSALEGLNEAVYLLYATWAEGWDDPAGTLQEALVDALVDRAVHLFNGHRSFEAARNDARRAYCYAPNDFRALHSYCHATIFYALYKYHSGGDSDTAAALLREAEEALEGGDPLYPGSPLLQECRKNLAQVREVMAGEAADSSSLEVPALEVEGTIGPFEEGILVEAQEKFVEAIRLYEQIPADNPRHPEARARMAYCYRRLCQEATPGELPRLVAQALASCPAFSTLSEDVVAEVLATSRAEVLEAYRRQGAGDEVVESLLTAIRSKP